MITKEQYHEASHVNFFQESLEYWEKRKSRGRPQDDIDYGINYDSLIINAKETLKELTGNERGFLDDRPL
jgi:hypothetical protein